ncbi:MAG: DUF2671 domain-containing protein [Rickettsiaceae bacterium]|nr:DUF2671 domain-containing protein [Rickettsiaceae bacterium]
MTDDLENKNDILTDIRYICKVTPIITDSLQRGCDVAQLPNGDIIVTETKVVNTQYSWDEGKIKMVRATRL